MPYSIGEHVDGRYQICALLGEGGMAQVYRAVDTSIGRDVVLKEPHIAIAGDLDSFNRRPREHAPQGENRSTAGAPTPAGRTAFTRSHRVSRPPPPT